MELVARETFWNAERVSKLRKDNDLGLLYEDIAARLGTSTGAVCGKIGRLGIGRGQPSKRKVVTEVATAPVDAVVFAILRQQDDEAERRIGVSIPHHKLEDHHCKFVLGDPIKRRVCGVTRMRTRLGRSPYCAEHAARCFDPSKSLIPIPRGRTSGMRPAYRNRAGDNVYLDDPVIGA